MGICSRNLKSEEYRGKVKYIYGIRHVKGENMPKYSTISIPKELHEEIEELIKKNPGLGYTSVAELCKEAIRLRLSEIRMEQREEILSETDIEDLLETLEKSLKKK